MNYKDTRNAWFILFFLMALMGPFSYARASVTQFYQTGFLSNGASVNYATATSTVSFGYTVSDLDAIQAKIYSCEDLAACSVTWNTGAAQVLVAHHATSTIDFSTISTRRPYLSAYIAVEEFDVSGNYLREFNVANTYLNGGFAVIDSPTNSTTTVSTTTVSIVDNPNLDIFMVLLLFLIVFTAIIFFFRNPSYLTRT